MTTLLDCIYRESAIIEGIVENKDINFSKFLDYVKDKTDIINEIIFIGSGTSNTSSVTACRFVEKVSNISANVMLPNEFLSKKVYNKKGLYVFVSQSGTSSLTKKSLQKVKDLGLFTVAITEAEDTPLAMEADVHINMGSGYEEYGMRTIGYCASTFTLMVMGILMGKASGDLSETQVKEYMDEALLVTKKHKRHCDDILKWFDNNKARLMDADAFAFYGNESLWGVAKEGALKVLEIARRFMCVGYEMDDGLHGPTMGFTNRHVIIILNDGGKDEYMATSFARYIKNEVGQAYIIGKNAIDEYDFGFEPISDNFKFLEFAPVVQILAYRLAVDYGIVLKDMKSMIPMPESKYFNTHDE